MSRTLRRDLNSILEDSKLGTADKMTALGLGLEGGARKSKKRSTKKSSAKKATKKSSATKSAKRSAKKSSAKKSAKHSAKKSSRKMSRELPAGMKAHLDFVAFLLKDMGVVGGPPIQVVAKMYKDIARKNSPDADSVELAKLARKVYEDEKKSSPGKPKQRLETAKQQLADKKAAKKA